MADKMNGGFSTTTVLLQYSVSVGTFGQLAHTSSLTAGEKHNSSDSYFNHVYKINTNHLFTGSSPAHAFCQRVKDDNNLLALSKTFIISEISTQRENVA